MTDFNLEQIYDSIDDLDDRNKCRLVILHLFSLVEYNSHYRGLQQYEQLISQLDISRCGIRVLLSFVRGSGVYVRYASLKYRTFVQSVHEHFNNIGKNADKLLIGIVPLAVKPIVHFKTAHFQRICIGESAIVLPLDHPSDLVSNEGYIQTSPVLKYDQYFNVFETNNTIYVNVA